MPPVAPVAPIPPCCTCSCCSTCACSSGLGLLVAPVAAPAPVGPNTPSQPPTAPQYKLITDMVKINPQLVWSDQQDAHRFLTGLENILEFSPVLHAHWTSLIPMMIPGQYELERTWVRNNIMTPLLSWNAAKAAFIASFSTR